MRRHGMTYRVHDLAGGVVVGLDPTARGGIYYPVAFLHWRRRSFRLVLPHLSFRWAFRLRHVGGLRVYRAAQRFYFRIGR